MASPIEKEWSKLIKKEEQYLKKISEKKTSPLNHFLEEKIPEKLQTTLDTAFFKAFQLIFAKGTGIIEKTYSKEDAEHSYKVNSFSVDLKEDRKNLKKFSKNASSSTTKNLLISGLEGVGLGVLGIGLPDIPLFTGMLLKSLYEIALHYGYDYNSPEEKYFILQIIQAAFSYDYELKLRNEHINKFIENPQLPLDYAEGTQTKNAASKLSTELLYMKFLQGLPLVGVVGGMYNPLYLQKVQTYGKFKYARRFLHDRKNNKKI